MKWGIHAVEFFSPIILLSVFLFSPIFSHFMCLIQLLFAHIGTYSFL